MPDRTNKMMKLEFLLGHWTLAYRVPQSSFSPATSGTGTGVFKKALKNRYITFDYKCSLTLGDSQAHAIFAWDPKDQVYRLWWFEDSGNFSTAIGRMIDGNCILLEWRDSGFLQTFRKVDSNTVLLRMENPVDGDEDELIMEVFFTRQG